ncbi:DUF4124 domain-containing protein [Pseudoduganella eburnea]|uniref:DUF4124 domain-containing protein n=1 Tax=Massilia eburnea TaxID=1776165 RepID=A0A6L6QMN7_9BURK|nr:DUF4124 domain-containing protein [Massilia eburnea]MTW13435.1 DUF4124 domain-containing protein [Massilia eburnea]
MNQRITRLALATALIACTSLAQAQWMWVNEKGVKQLSDQPPPPGTPANKILKAPRGAGVADLRNEMAPAPAEGDDAAAADTKAPKPKPTLAERNADFNKRQKENAEKTAKAEEEAKREAERKKYCTEAKANIGLLESGARISDTAPNGERTFLSDQDRARKIKEQRESVNSTCK